MAITRIDIPALLKMSCEHPVIDVRSEGEFAHAHFPGAISVPLFDNEERGIIGTAYKKESKQKAIKIGLKMFGKKMVDIVEKLERILDNEPGRLVSKTVIVHCWRGGMRSGGVGWLLDLYGFKVYTLTGGYKAFRRWSMQQLEKDYSLQVIGGYTGSGKTGVLQEMKKRNVPVIDLEDLARHKGSAFGNIGMPPQPSQEMFENLLALELFKADDSCRTDDSYKLTDDGQKTDTFLLSTVNSQPSICIWIEDESQRIGLVNLPTSFYKMMRSKTLYFLNVPFTERLKHIVAEYGKADKEELIKAVTRIEKRLGGLEAKTAVKHLTEDNLELSFQILLKYYDKQYLKGLQTRENLDDLLLKLDCQAVNPVENADSLIFMQVNKHECLKKLNSHNTLMEEAADAK